MNVVEMHNITKQFGELLANDNVEFELRKGEIHALLGENGAGKTTLMRILYGLYQQTTGDIFINGNAVEIKSPKDAIANGIWYGYSAFCFSASYVCSRKCGSWLYRWIHFGS